MAASVNPEAVVIYLLSYFATVFNALLRRAKEGGMPMETAFLVLGIVRSCHMTIEYSEQEHNS